MNNCSSLVKEHGLKLWFSNFLGYSILFWVISWISTWSSFPTSNEEVSNAVEHALTSPTDLLMFLVSAGLFLIIPAFLQAAGTSLTVDAVAKNETNIENYFCGGFKKLGKMYQLTLISIVCYLPAILVSKHANFQFSEFSFSSDNLLGLLSIALFIVTGLFLIHAPYILISKDTSACNAVSQSFQLFTQHKGNVFLSLLYASLICGVVVGSAYCASPSMFETLHPVRFLLASITLTLTMFTVTYRYFKHLDNASEVASCSSEKSSTCSSTEKAEANTCSDTDSTKSCSETSSEDCSTSDTKKED